LTCIHHRQTNTNINKQTEERDEKKKKKKEEEILHRPRSVAQQHIPSEMF